MPRYGGVKKKHDAYTSFQAVVAMLKVSIVTSISYSSVSGLIFQLSAEDDEDAQFFALNDAGTQFNKPVRKLVLKLALVSSDPILPRVPRLEINGQKYKKSVSPLQEFSEEAARQQEIYLKTLENTGKPICLAVVDFSYFDAIHEAHKFLGGMELRCDTHDADALRMIAFLADSVQENVHLAMIAMELADQEEFVTLGRMRTSPEVYAQVYERSIAQLVILFLRMKLVNYDCHMGNILVKTDGTRSFLIDFGRVVNARDMVSSNPDDLTRSFYDTYAVCRDVRSRISYKNDYADVADIDLMDLYVDRKRNEGGMIALLETIFLFIIRVDQAWNTVHYNHIFPQCTGLMNYVYRNRNYTEPEVFRRILAVIRDLTEVPIKSKNHLSHKAIDAMIRDNKVFSHKSYSKQKRTLGSSTSRTSKRSRTLPTTLSGNSLLALDKLPASSSMNRFLHDVFQSTQSPPFQSPPFS